LFLVVGDGPFTYGATHAKRRRVPEEDKTGGYGAETSVMAVCRTVRDITEVNGAARPMAQDEQKSTAPGEGPEAVPEKSLVYCTL
jgi:hypothetical protein